MDAETWETVRLGAGAVLTSKGFWGGVALAAAAALAYRKYGSDAVPRIRGRWDRRPGQGGWPLPVAVLAVVALAAGVVIAVVFLLAWQVLGVAPNGQFDKAKDLSADEESRAFFDVLRIALTTAAGIGGAVALVVAYRRQKHLETDDVGRRSRYASAAQQLGDPQAAVRLAGVYAMANLADEWEDQRQQCVDVLCAYLRLPWSDGTGQLESTTTTVDQLVTGPDEKIASRSYANRSGEREVRRTLLRVVAEHLQDRAPVSWSALRLDFTNAVLADADFYGARVSPDASFVGATFTGDARFVQATFKGVISFAGATFESGVMFNGSTFGDGAQYSEVNFSKVTFKGSASFRLTTFSAPVFFAGATFEGGAWFHGATITCGGFSGTTFSREAEFSGATFSGVTSFDAATFTADTSFERAAFTDDADFEAATFSSVARVDAAPTLGDTWFEPRKAGISFDGAVFSGHARFDTATFEVAADFQQTSFLYDDEKPSFPL